MIKIYPLPVLNRRVIVERMGAGVGDIFPSNLFASPDANEEGTVTQLTNELSVMVALPIGWGCRGRCGSGGGRRRL